MKKTSKLVALITTFALVTATIVIPVKASVPTAPENLLPGMGYNSSFEDIITSKGYTSEGGTATAEIVTPDGAMPEPIDGNSYLKFTNRSAKGAKISFKNIGLYGGTPLEAGKSYEVSYYLCTLPDSDGNATSTTAKVYASTANESTNIIKVGSVENNNNVTVNSDGFAKVSCVVNIVSTGLEASSSVKYKGIHIGTDIGDTANVYVDDFCVKEVVPEMKLLSATGIEDGAVGVDLNAEVSLSFTNAPYQLTEDNVVLTHDGVAVEGKVSVTTVDDKNYIVLLSNLDAGKKYNLSLYNVQDMFAQFVDWDIDFTTSYSFNILSRNGYDYSYENGDEITIDTASGTIIPTIVTRGDFMPAPVGSGTKYLKATDITGNGRVRFDFVGENGDVQLKEGSTYELSFYARTIPDENGDNVDGVAKAYFETAAPEINTVYPVDVIETEYAINGDRWTKVMGRVTIAEASPELDGRFDTAAERVYKGIHVGFTITSTSGVYIDNWDLREVITDFKMTSSIENGANDVKTNAVVLTFTSAPVGGFSENNIISDYNVTVDKISDTEYKVTLGEEFLYGTDYSFTVIDVLDKFGQIITDETISFTTGVRPGVSGGAPSNLLPDMGVDYSFETTIPGLYPNTIVAEIVTPSDDMPIAIDGTKYLKLTNRTAATDRIRFNQIGMNKAVQLEAGKLYEVSYYACTLPDNEGNPTSTTAKVFISSTLVSTNTIQPGTVENNGEVVVNSDGFTKVSCIVPITETGKTSADGAVNKGILIGTDFGDTVDVYIDNFSVKEYYPDFKMSTTFENGSTDVELKTVIPVQFSNEPWTFDEKSVKVLSNDEIDDKVNVETQKIDNTNYNIILSNLSIKTKYSFVISGVLDNYGQELPEMEPISFTTVFASNILDKTGYDYSFENGINDGTITTGNGVMSIVSASEYGWTAADGLKVLRLSDRSAGSIYSISNVAAGCFEVGKKYIVSYKIKLSGNGSDKAGVYVAANNVNNILKPDSGNSVASVNVASSDGWVDVTYVFAMEENPNGNVNGGIDIGVIIAGKTTAYIDKFEVKEYIPKFELVTDPVDGESSVASDVITLNFSNIPTEFTKEKIGVINTETEEPLEFDFNSVSGTVYTLKLRDIEYDTKYTMFLKENVYDEYDQYLSATITFVTCTERSEFKNSLATDASFGFEDSENGIYLSGVSTGIYTVVNEEIAGVSPYEGNKMLKATGISDTAIGYDKRFMNFTNVEIGKKYFISYYARTIDAGKTTASVYYSNSQTSTNDISVKVISSEATEINSNEWTRVSAIYEVIKNPDLKPGNSKGNQGFHFGAKVKGVDCYIDGFTVLEIPQEDFGVSNSTPEHNSKEININVGTINVNYSAGFADKFVGEIKLYSGLTDLTDTLVKSYGVIFGNSGIEIKVGELKNSTTYRLVITGVTDYLGRSADSTIIFTTANAVTTAGWTDNEGNPLNPETISNPENLGRTFINVTNSTNSVIKRPLYIYTIYSPEGTLVKSGTTRFDGEIAAGDNFDLEFDFSGKTDVLEGNILTLYLINSFDNLTMATEPLVFDFTN